MNKLTTIKGIMVTKRENKTKKIKRISLLLVPTDFGNETFLLVKTLLTSPKTPMYCEHEKMSSTSQSIPLPYLHLELHIENLGSLTQFVEAYLALLTAST
jgi:hypothetical protein